MQVVTIAEPELPPVSINARATNAIEAYLAQEIHENHLRPAQLRVMHDLERFFAHSTAGYIDLPTGSGKTVLFTEVIRATDLKSLVLVPTTQLVQQTLEKFAERGITDVRVASVTQPERLNARVTVATYASLVKQFRKPNGSFVINPALYELVVLDEAHHAMAEGTSDALTEFEHAIKIGFSASPDYSEERELRSLLPELIHRLSMIEAIEMGLINSFSNPVLFTNADMSKVGVTALGDFDLKQLDEALNNDVRNNVIAAFFASTLADKKAIFSCGGVDHALAMAETLRQHGINAEAIHGQMPVADKNNILERFSRGEITALTNNKLLSEGFDDPAAEVAINVSPTLSYVRQQQRSGRVMRVDPTNPQKHALIIDCIDTNYRKPPILFSHQKIADAAHWPPRFSFPESTEAVLQRLSAYHSDGTFVELDADKIEQAVSARRSYVKPKVSKTTDNSGEDDDTQTHRSPFLFSNSGDLDWQDQGLCAQTDPEAFFPEKGGSTREAKRVCTTCDVRVQCLEYALDHNERFGIWGGLSERERRRLLKSTAKQVSTD